MNKLYGIVSEYEDLYPFHIFSFISSEFLKKIEEYNSGYIQFQINNIKETFIRSTTSDYKYQIDHAYKWCKKYGVEINKNNKYKNMFDMFLNY